jgi:hypothetical protein
VTYGEALLGWRDFYVTAGAAAATLVGLLFVGLSLHIKVVVSRPDVRSLARVTLADFFVVLLVALVVLAPATDAWATGAWLAGVSAVSLGLVVRPAVQAFRLRRTRTIGRWVLLSRFGLSALCYLGVGTTGVLLGRHDFDTGLSGLLIVVILLLAVSIRNTWDLLITVADSLDAGGIRHSRS